MLRAIKFFIGLVVIGLVAQAQPVTPVITQSLTLVAQAPPAITSISLSLVGNPGNATYYYWVVAKYPSGNANPSPAAIITTAPNTLSVNNYVRVNWGAMANATGYDVLRTTTPTLPNGANNIAVALNTASTTVNDTGAALSSYTVASQSQISTTCLLDNVSATPSFSCNPYAPSGTTPGGAAGGGLTGTYPNPLIAGVSTQGAIPFQSASTGILTTDATNWLFDNANTRLQLGPVVYSGYETKVLASFRRNNTTKYTSYNDQYGLMNYYRYDTTGMGTSSIDLYGFRNEINFAGDADLNASSAGGTAFTAIGTTSGTVKTNYLYGMDSGVTISGTSQVTDAVGGRTFVALASNGTATNITGHWFRVNNFGAGAAPTNVTTVYIAGTVAGVNNWNLYSEAGSGTQARNYLGGPTGIGPLNTTPTHTLDVYDATSVSGSTRLVVTRGAADTVDSLTVQNDSTTKANQFVWGAGTEPTCNAGNRGRVTMVQGGAGVADTFRICAKDAADAYNWVALY